MNFEVIGEITGVETIASGSGKWRKLKGVARVQLANGRIRLTELHWYEAYGIGKREIKRKRYLD